MKKNNRTQPRQSWTFDEYTNSEIRRAAETGIYDIRGGGSKRKLPHFLPFKRYLISPFYSTFFHTF